MSIKKLVIENLLILLVSFFFVILLTAPKLTVNVLASWFYYGGAFAFPLLFVTSASLEFWEIFLGEAKYPFAMPERMGFWEVWLKNMKIGFFEELIFRSPVWIISLAHLPVVVPAFISSLLFGLAHYEYGPAKIPSAFTSGMFLCAIAVNYGLMAAIIAHAFLDLFVTIQAIYLK